MSDEALAGIAVFILFGPQLVPLLIPRLGRSPALFLLFGAAQCALGAAMYVAFDRAGWVSMWPLGVMLPGLYYLWHGWQIRQACGGRATQEAPQPPPAAR